MFYCFLEQKFTFQMIKNMDFFVCFVYHTQRQKKVNLLVPSLLLLLLLEKIERKSPVTTCNRNKMNPATYLKMVKLINV